MRTATARLAISLLWISVASAPLRSQTPGQKLAFEIASIKPNKNGVFGYGGSCLGADKKQGPTAMVIVPVGHCRLVNVPVEYIVNLAYRAEITPGDDPPALVGLPPWAKSERFDVETKSEDLTVTQAQLYEMLRTLLSDRFHLEFHRVTREVPGYRLTVAKGGHKLATAKSDEPTGFGGLGPRGEAISRNRAITDLVSFLTHQLDSPVENATGLDSKYDFHLTFDPASTGHQFSTGPAPEIPGRPSLFAALQEQLGLKLEKTRLPVVSYVVDRIEQPSAN